MHIRQDEPTVGKNLTSLETINKWQPASWLSVGFFAKLVGETVREEQLV